MTTYAPVRDAYRAWLKTADQLTFDELLDATSPMGAHDRDPLATVSGHPAATPHNERRPPQPHPGKRGGRQSGAS